MEVNSFVDGNDLVSRRSIQSTSTFVVTFDQMFRRLLWSALLVLVTVSFFVCIMFLPEHTYKIS